MAEILILGGTGKTGRRVAAELRRRGHTPRAVSRSSVTRFDWHDRATWAPALEGVSAAYVVDSQGPDAAALLGEFAGLAVAKDVSRLVYLSARDWAVSGGDERLAAERALQASGSEWTILRPTWFAQNFSEASHLAGPVRDGELVLPTGHGQEPFVDAEDIAAVAAVTLTEPGHAGEIYELSGPRLLTFGEAVDEIARVSGRDIAYVPVTHERYAEHAAERRYFSPALVDELNTLCGWIAAGRNAHLSDGVQRVLDRKPRDFREYVRATW